MTTIADQMHEVLFRPILDFKAWSWASAVTAVAFATIMFPFLTPLKIPIDNQPWPLIICAVIAVYLLVIRRSRLPIPLWVLLGTSLYAGLLYLCGVLGGIFDPFVGARSLWGYASFGFITAVAYLLYKHLKPWMLMGVIVGWLAGTLIQAIFGTQVMEFIVYRISTGHGRGFTSFASEPSFYATICIILLLLNELMYAEGRYGTKVYGCATAALLGQGLLSYSVTGMLFVLWFMIARAVTLPRDRRRHLLRGLLPVSAIGLFALGGLAATDEFQNSRAVMFALKMAANSGDQEDESAMVRIVNPALAVGGFIRSDGIGYGLGLKKELQKPLDGWFREVAPSELDDHGWGARLLLGGMLSSIYELGYAGLPLLIAALYLMWKAAVTRSPAQDVCWLTLLVMLPLTIMVGSLSFPPFSLVLGVQAFYAYGRPARAPHYKRTATGISSVPSV